MKSCVKCIRWDVCEYWTKDYGYPNKNPFPLYFEDEEKVDMCGFYKSRSEYELEIAEKFVEKLMAKADLIRINAFDSKWAISENDIDEALKEMEK